MAWVAALPWIVQPFLRLILWFRYDLRRVGLENLPRTGPVLLASNHISWFDGFFLAAALPRRATALVNAGVFGLPVVGFLARRCGLISVPYPGPKAQRAAIEACRKALDEGRVLADLPRGPALPERPDRPVPPGARGDPLQEGGRPGDPGLPRQRLGEPDELLRRPVRLEAAGGLAADDRRVLRPAGSSRR